MSEATPDADIGTETTTQPEWVSLDPGEEVVWTGRPAFETLYGTIATGLVLTVVVIGVLILLGVPFAYVRIQNTEYVVTTQSLYVKTGIFSTNIETVDLDRIQNTEFNRSFWGKQFDYGSISISTAGSSGAEISFDGIPDAPAVRDRITELKRQRTEREGTEGEGGDAPASAAQLTELIEEVRATREAFERIERRLADGTDDDPDDQSRTNASSP
ncbi:PH domain-containing protein [Haloplanus ruber]|uniref:PH domain-containing protein n=1 Tax=Haloplanus ruber TaxID=869892 RepID=A0ABD6D0Q6_9EURY|nr:PH domain-containing protein [Haloplanus ruber]